MEKPSVKKIIKFLGLENRNELVATGGYPFDNTDAVAAALVTDNTNARIEKANKPSILTAAQELINKQIAAREKENQARNQRINDASENIRKGEEKKKSYLQPAAGPIRNGIESDYYKSQKGALDHSRAKGHISQAYYDRKLEDLKNRLGIPQ